ncbi:MAG TPA: hypothetical protein VHH73_16015, partial [Verrucomicrobiae bacterium]|nr:hypothetical protein [Verrucomicrobiae bacterium]
YSQLASELKSSLEQTMGTEETKYFLANIKENPSLSPEYGGRERRVTLILADGDQPGGGPVFIGQEYRNPDGSWSGGSIAPVEHENEVTSPVIRNAIAEMKKNAATPKP